MLYFTSTGLLVEDKPEALGTLQSYLQAFPINWEIDLPATHVMCRNGHFEVDVVGDVFIERQYLDPCKSCQHFKPSSTTPHCQLHPEHDGCSDCDDYLEMERSHEYQTTG